MVDVTIELPTAVPHLEIPIKRYRTQENENTNELFSVNMPTMELTALASVAFEYIQSLFISFLFTAHRCQFEHKDLFHRKFVHLFRLSIPI